MKKTPKKSPGEKNCVNQTGCALRLQAVGPTGSCETLAVRTISQRGFWRGFLQSDIRSSYSAQETISLMLVQWFLKLVALFLHHTVLFQNVIYQRKRQGCPDNFILSCLWYSIERRSYWLANEYQQGAIQANVHPVLCLSARKGSTFTGIIIVMWICFPEMSVSHDILWGLIASNLDFSQVTSPFWFSRIVMICVLDGTTEVGASHMMALNELQHCKEHRSQLLESLHTSHV